MIKTPRSVTLTPSIAPNWSASVLKLRAMRKLRRKLWRKIRQIIKELDKVSDNG
jgi:hypothetical protein